VWSIDSTKQTLYLVEIVEGTDLITDFQIGGLGKMKFGRFVVTRVSLGEHHVGLRLSSIGLVTDFWIENSW
jgi:hypothetical protein